MSMSTNFGRRKYFEATKVELRFTEYSVSIGE